MHIIAILKTLARDDSGATAMEYGLLAATISVAIILGAQAAGTALNTLFTNIGERLQTAADAAAGD